MFDPEKHLVYNYARELGIVGLKVIHMIKDFVLNRSLVKESVKIHDIMNVGASMSQTCPNHVPNFQCP